MPRVIHLDWCVCSVKDFKVLESAHAIVNPGVSIDSATTAATRLTQATVEREGITFTDALEKLTRSIELTIGNGKYRVVSFGDWPVRYQMALEALACGTALPEKISAHFVNVLDLHYEQNSGP